MGETKHEGAALAVSVIALVVSIAAAGTSFYFAREDLDLKRGEAQAQTLDVDVEASILLYRRSDDAALSYPKRGGSGPHTIPVDEWAGARARYVMMTVDNPRDRLVTLLDVGLGTGSGLWTESDRKATWCRPPGGSWSVCPAEMEIPAGKTREISFYLSDDLAGRIDSDWRERGTEVCWRVAATRQPVECVTLETRLPELRQTKGTPAPPNR